MLSFKTDQKVCLQKLNKTANVTNGVFLDFLGNIQDAMKKNKMVEFLYFNAIENDDIVYTGLINDIYVSDSIFTKNYVFLVFDINVNGENIFVQSPPIKENTVESNGNSLNKYYFYDDVINNNASTLDPRIRVTIL